MDTRIVDLINQRSNDPTNTKLDKEIYDLKFLRKEAFGNEWVDPDTG